MSYSKHETFKDGHFRVRHAYYEGFGSATFWRNAIGELPIYQYVSDGLRIDSVNPSNIPDDNRDLNTYICN